MRAFVIAATGCLFVAAGARADYFEDFNGDWPAAGWTLIDNTGEGGWDVNTYFEDDNWTTADGTCAEINSDFFGFGAIDAELISPEVYIGADYVLSFLTNYYTYSGGPAEIADVDITTDGGSSWTNLIQWNQGDDQGGFESGDGVPRLADLGAFEGETVQVRFHYYDSNSDWYWQVDDVFIGAVPGPGGLLVLAIGGLLAGRRRRVEPGHLLLVTWV